MEGYFNWKVRMLFVSSIILLTSCGTDVYVNRQDYETGPFAIFGIIGSIMAVIWIGAHIIKFLSLSFQGEINRKRRMKVSRKNEIVEGSKIRQQEIMVGYLKRINSIKAKSDENCTDEEKRIILYHRNKFENEPRLKEILGKPEKFWTDEEKQIMEYRRNELFR